MSKRNNDRQQNINCHWHMVTSPLLWICPHWIPVYLEHNLGPETVSHTFKKIFQMINNERHINETSFFFYIHTSDWLPISVNLCLLHNILHIIQHLTVVSIHKPLPKGANTATCTFPITTAFLVNILSFPNLVHVKGVVLRDSFSPLLE